MSNLRENWNSAVGKTLFTISRLSLSASVGSACPAQHSPLDTLTLYHFTVSMLEQSHYGANIEWHWLWAYVLQQASISIWYFATTFNQHPAADQPWSNPATSGHSVAALLLMRALRDSLAS